MIIGRLEVFRANWDNLVDIAIMITQELRNNFLIVYLKFLASENDILLCYATCWQANLLI